MAKPQRIISQHIYLSFICRWGLRIMLHEARDRQKFVSDAQYLRDMQHKVDSEYQVIAENESYLPPSLTVL